MAKKPRTYRTAEICKLLSIQPYVLKHWEEEFPALAGSAGSGGQRVFSEADLGLIRRVRGMLYEEGYTIAAARKKLEAELPLHPAGLFADPAPRDAPAAPPAKAKPTAVPEVGADAAGARRAGAERKARRSEDPPRHDDATAEPAGQDEPAPWRLAVAPVPPNGEVGAPAGVTTSPGSGSASVEVGGEVSTDAADAPPAGSSSPADLSGGTSAVASETATEHKREAGSLDTSASQRVQTLRRGIAEALEEARALLAAIGAAPPPR